MSDYRWVDPWADACLYGLECPCMIWIWKACICGPCKPLVGKTTTWDMYGGRVLLDWCTKHLPLVLGPMWPARGPSRIPVHASTVVRAARCLGLTKNDMAATWAVVRNLPWQLRLEKVKIEVADYLHQQLHHVRCHSTTRRTIAHELVISGRNDKL